VDDLNDADIQFQWSDGRFELVEGVLAKISPQGLHGSKPLPRLRRMIERQLTAPNFVKGEFYFEVDLLLRPNRIPRPDMLFLTAAQDRRQEELEIEQAINETDYCPILVMPLLIVESVSVGHESHDRVTKREWYEQAGIPNYWILTAHERSLVCLSLKGSSYVEEAAGQNDAILHTSAFGGLTLPLAELWRRVSGGG
jgi:Uma2 family endonuclease